MNDILITIIVPAYNIELYIERCLESIINQSYSNLEIIVIDDGSTDNTGKIIDKYKELDSRIKVIHKKNGGVSSARIMGIKHATGEYIGFVDGDDCIESNMYSILLRNAKKYNADISHCGYKMVFPSRSDDYYNTGKTIEQNKEEGIKALIEGEYIEPGIWNKLYKRTLFIDILNLIPLDIKINEDFLMNYYLFKKSNKAIYQDVCLYQYRVRKGSAANSDFNEHKLKDPINVTKIVMEDCKDIPELYKSAQKRLLSQMIAISVMPDMGCEFVKNFKKEIRRELQIRIKKILSKSDYDIKIKLKSMWGAYFPLTYSLIHKIYSKVKGTDKKYEIK